MRTRLLRLLRGRWDRQVTAVAAGAGFGKTSLLSQAINENRLDPNGEDVWVACHPGDEAASVLGGHVHAALGTTAPDGDDAVALGRSVADAVASRAPVQVCLVVDDVHLLPPGSGGADLLQEVLAQLPTNGHLVVAGRTSPPLPLARLLALGQAERLVEDDLAFDDDELAAFAQLRETPLDRLQAAARWPAVAELTVSAEAPVVGEFLWEEILDRLPDERRRELAVLSALDGADDVELSAALGHCVDVAEVVADLPLATLTDGRAVLHALWAPSLARVLPESDRRQALLAVAGLRRSAGRYEEAWALLRRVEAWDELFDLIPDICGLSYPLASVDVLEQWRDDLLASWPGRAETDLLVGAVTFYRSADPAASLPTNLRAWARFREAGNVKGEVAAMVGAFAGAYFTVGQEGVMVDILTRVMELDAAGNPEVAGLAPVAEGVYARFLGDYATALRHFQSPPREALSREWNTMHNASVAEAFASLGEPERGLAHLARWPYDEPGVLGDVRQEALTSISCLAGALGDAWDRVRAALDRPGLTGGRWRQGFESAAARIGAFLGLVDEARPYLDAALAHGYPTDDYMNQRVAIAEAAVAVSTGDEAGAVQALRRTALAPSYSFDRYCALPYVLGPECRPAYDAAPLGGAIARTRELARALVDVREGGGLERVAQLPSLEPRVVRPALPLPWATLLAVAGEAVGRADARPLLEALGPGTRAWLGCYADHDQPKLRTAARRLLADIPAEPDHHVTVRLLGPVELAFDDEVVEPAPWRRERVRELMAWLAVHPTTTREATGDALWPDLDAEAAANNLRTQLSALLQALQPERRAKEASYFVTQGERSLTLGGRDRLTVDVWELDRHLEEAHAAERAGAPSVALASYRAAADLWRGPFLGGAGTAWADDEAERLRAAFVHAAARGAELAAAAGDLSGAATLARRALESDPWSERSFRALATAQLAEGDEAGATQTLIRCDAALAELGVEPEPATRMLQTRLSALTRG